MNLEIEHVTGGTLVWPKIGWDVLSLFGVMPVAEELSYVDTIIPPPLHACISSDTSVDNLLFSVDREFKLSGEPNSHSISSDEYHSLIVDAKDVSLLYTHA